MQKLEMFAHWWLSFSGFEWCFQFWTYNSIYWDYIVPSITKFKMKSAAGSKDVVFPLSQPQAPLNQHLITCRQSVIKPKQHPKTPYTATSRSQLYNRLSNRVYISSIPLNMHNLRQYSSEKWLNSGILHVYIYYLLYSQILTEKQLLETKY